MSREGPSFAETLNCQVRASPALLNRLARLQLQVHSRPATQFANLKARLAANVQQASILSESRQVRLRAPATRRVAAPSGAACGCAADPAGCPRSSAIAPAPRDIGGLTAKPRRYRPDRLTYRRQHAIPQIAVPPACWSSHPPAVCSTTIKGPSVLIVAGQTVAGELRITLIDAAKSLARSSTSAESGLYLRARARLSSTTVADEKWTVPDQSDQSISSRRRALGRRLQFSFEI